MEDGKHNQERVAFVDVYSPDIQITNDDNTTSRSFSRALFQLPVMTAPQAALVEWHTCVLPSNTEQ